MNARRIARIGVTLAAVTLAAASTLEAQRLRTVTTSRQLGRERELDVRITYGAG